MAALLNGCEIITGFEWNLTGKQPGPPIIGYDHASCSGGSTTPGVLGGWVCSCECHRVTEVTPWGRSV